MPYHAALRFLALRVSGMQGTQSTSADPFELSSAVQPRSLSSNAKEAMRKTHHRNNGLKSANGSERFFATQWHWQVKEAERVKPSQRHEGSTSVYLKGSVSMRFPSWQANSCISVHQCLSSFQLLCDLHFAELVPRGCLWLHADILAALWQHYRTLAYICNICTHLQNLCISAMPAGFPSAVVAACILQAQRPVSRCVPVGRFKKSELWPEVLRRCQAQSTNTHQWKT